MTLQAKLDPDRMLVSIVLSLLVLVGSVSASEEDNQCVNSNGSEEGECRNPYIEAVASTIPQWPGQTCDLDPHSLKSDLDRYPQISFEDVNRAETLYGAHARRYVISQNKLYARDCHPNAIVGVARFVEDMLVQLLQQVSVPDVDFILNCADHPTVPNYIVNQDTSKDAPMVSMCGSTQYRDIIVPTYTLALAVTGRMRVDEEARIPWEQRHAKLVWRGTDSNYDRFTFNLLANSPPYVNYTDVGINQMVRIKHDITLHGPVKASMPQTDFGNYKWIANVDGAVAAYRMPAVAALGSTIVMQESHFLEHWYREFNPWTHYVPMKHDFSDLNIVLDWLQSHDEDAKRIGAAGRAFALEHLQPQSILCFWYVFIQEYAARMTYAPTVLDGMKAV